MVLHRRYCPPCEVFLYSNTKKASPPHQPIKYVPIGTLLVNGMGWEVGDRALHGAKKGVVVTQTGWEWPIATDLQKHHERVALLRPVPFEMTTQVDGPSDSVRSGKALSLNISSGGMLVLMDHAPEVEQVLKVLVPTPTSLAGTPTLAEVRWTRRLPFGRQNGQGTYFVGLKFIF